MRNPPKKKILRRQEAGKRKTKMSSVIGSREAVSCSLAQPPSLIYPNLFADTQQMLRKRPPRLRYYEKSARLKVDTPGGQEEACKTDLFRIPNKLVLNVGLTLQGSIL